jgi:diaminopimelate epimerase
VARRLGFCDDRIRVLMPGGALDLEFDADWRVTQSGPVRAVAQGTLAPDLLAAALGSAG